MCIFRSDYEAKLAMITVEIVYERFTVPSLLLSSLQSSTLSKVTLFSWVNTENITRYCTEIFLYIGVLHGHVYGIYHKYFYMLPLQLQYYTRSAA